MWYLSRISWRLRVLIDYLSDFLEVIKIMMKGEEIACREFSRKFVMSFYTNLVSSLLNIIKSKYI